MEFGEHIKYKQLENIEEDLINNLKILHSLNIIHYDIKPENICYSKVHKKHVFIDYGLHVICKEPNGSKKLSAFRARLFSAVLR